MRARGANALLASVFESTYGTPPASGFLQLPFVSSSLGEEQGLIESDLLGQGRESQDPTLDVINNDGNLVVPVDSRAFGHWLTLYLGEPTTAAFGPASGTIKFSGQPANNGTIALAGTTFTFVTGSPTGNQIQIGGSLSVTLDNAVTVLNGSVVPAVAAATYSKVGTDTLKVLHDTAGLAGNSFALAAGTSPASNGTASGATLSGGTVKHTFTSGGDALPSMSIETGMPEVPSFEMNFGVRGNTMQVQLSRRGLLNATLGLIAKGSDLADVTAAGTPDTVDADRFAQATGQIKKDGVQLGSVTGATMSMSNNLDKVETIQPDGRIEDADPGMFRATGNITTRFADRKLLDLAGAGTPLELSYGWTKDTHSLLFTLPRVFLPRPKREVTGPGGIQASFDWQASGEDGNSLIVELVNDVASYDLP